MKQKIFFSILSLMLLSCSSTPKFHDAIIANDRNSFENGLKSKKNINLVHNQQSSLDLAIKMKRYDFALMLLENGAHVVKRDIENLDFSSNGDQFNKLVGLMLSQAIQREDIEIANMLIERGVNPTIDDINNLLSENNLNYELLKLLKNTGIGYPSLYQKSLDDAYINDDSDRVDELIKLGLKGPSNSAKAEKKRKQLEILRAERAEKQRIARINILNGQCAAGMERDKNCYRKGNRVKCSAYRYSSGMRYFISFEYFCKSGEAYMKALGESDRKAVRYYALDRCCVSR